MNLNIVEDLDLNRVLEKVYEILIDEDGDDDGVSEGEVDGVKHSLFSSKTVDFP